MQKQYGNVMLRAFNGECDAAIANVAWNNITKMETRVEKAFAAINKLGTVMKVELNSHYLGLRLKELRLVHEHATKKQAEAEEQRRIRDQMREEERVQRELERAKQEADADERRYQRALDRAREEAARASGEEMNELNERVRQLEQSLAEAHARGERAVSQAQLTKCGHVYVISNIGSFGDDVFKIGMTRRLEPLDRIKELSDASVPFGFDVHAMIYSDDAPALEAALHRRFGEVRLNLINERKEFFRTDLSSIAGFAESLGLKAELTLVAEAREYRESTAKRAELAKQVQPTEVASSFPAALA
jgi:multidrug efflux pump subunit AcrA (membrane-fusion protein)